MTWIDGQQSGLLVAALESQRAAGLEPAAARPLLAARRQHGERLQVVVAVDPGSRLQQGARVGMRRAGEDVGDAPGLHDSAGVHDRHPVAQLSDHTEIVGDQEDGGVLGGADLSEQPKHLRLDRDVEGRRRLVRDDELRLTGQPHGDGGSLQHPARILVGVGAGTLLGGRYVHLSQ